jgi:dTMP kinase
VEEVRRLNEIATEGLKPDLVVVLDVAPETGVARADAGGEKRRDSIGQESLEFHRRVREGFLEIARAGGEGYAVIDAGRAKDAVAAEVLEKVSRMLAGEG